MTESDIVQVLRRASQSLRLAPSDYDDLLELVGDARLVLLGEASHGTHEFYQARAQISKRLISEKGFDAVAVEADWPDALRVSRYVRGESEDRTPNAALSDFRRFPTWMWRNHEIEAFVAWLREYDAARPHAQRVGFYGIDLYSLFRSIEVVLEYLDQTDREAAARARARYGCFDHFDRDSQRYGYATAFGLSESCEDGVVAQLLELQQRSSTALGKRTKGLDEAFYAEQNARLIVSAERYYRAMFGTRVSSWNLRDQHMADTVDQLSEHLRRRGGQGKIIVWAHNSHLGDARATEMGRRGELNVGQLLRQRHGDECRLIGFTTYGGTVTAASDWDGPTERKRVRPAMSRSYELLFHQLDVPDFFMSLREPEIAEILRQPRLERAIGVIYLPHSERYSHYFHASLASQFDAVLHFDTTRALEPLEGWPLEYGGEAPETYPSTL
ncbi:MAG: erythromycin esterase family protein [Deltaproteobacteria bacterium]|nr:erythromycin esterase family protein [Deltaproteobacteria bacterium]